MGKSETCWSGEERMGRSERARSSTGLQESNGIHKERSTSGKYARSGTNRVGGHVGGVRREQCWAPSQDAVDNHSRSAAAAGNIQQRHIQYNLQIISDIINSSFLREGFNTNTEARAAIF